MAQDGDIVPTHLDDDDHGPACPRCGADAMNDVVTIAPLLGEPGLIAYECPRCEYEPAARAAAARAQPVIFA
jgi:hypothetical protein